MPPAAASTAEYGTPVWPFASDAVVIVSVPDAMVSVRLTVAVWAVGVVESVTLNVSGVFVTPLVGVPPICPVCAFSVNPVGSVPDISCQLKGVVPPAAASTAEYGTPVWPFASDVVVIVSVGM